MINGGCLDEHKIDQSPFFLQPSHSCLSLAGEEKPIRGKASFLFECLFCVQGDWERLSRFGRFNPGPLDLARVATSLTRGEMDQDGMRSIPLVFASGKRTQHFCGTSTAESKIIEDPGAMRLLKAGRTLRSINRVPTNSIT